MNNPETQGMNLDIESDLNLSKFGYARGTYYITCSSCGRTDEDCARTSTRCLSCASLEAYRSHFSRARAAPNPLVDPKYANGPDRIWCGDVDDGLGFQFLFSDGTEKAYTADKTLYIRADIVEPPNPPVAPAPEIREELGDAWNQLSQAMHWVNTIRGSGLSDHKLIAKAHYCIELAHGIVQNTIASLHPKPQDPLKETP